MLDDDAESIPELQQRLRQLVGGRALVCPSMYFLARIDRVDFTAAGFVYSGKLLRPIESMVKCGFYYGNFERSYTWEEISGGRGMIAGPVHAWRLYYDQDLISSITRLLDANPAADLEVLRLISAWERKRLMERPE